MNFRIAFAALTLTGAGRAAAQDVCHPLESNAVRSVNALFDSTALASRMPIGTLGDFGELQITVVTGSKPRGYIVNSDPADTTASGFIGQVLGSLRPSRSAPSAFRLHVTFGASPTMAVAPALLCDPVALTEPKPVSYTVVVPSSARGSVGAAGTGPRRVTPSVRIGVNGEVLRVDVGGGTGNSQLDRSIQQSFQAQRWRAATLDGRPVSVIVTGKKVEIVR